MALAAVAPAAANPPPKAPTQQADSHEAEIGLARFADCVVRDDGRRTRAVQYLRMAADAPAAAELHKKLMPVDCLEKALPKSLAPTADERSERAQRLFSFDLYTLKVGPAAYRNALYPALYRFSFGKSGPGAIADKPPLAPSDEWDKVPDPLPEGWRVRRAIGDCVARGHPAAAHRLVISKPWSDAETAEIGEISTALAECLPAGQTVSLGREDVRGIVGEALYKLATAPAGSPASTGSDPTP
jgi:hypothetical protein